MVEASQKTCGHCKITLQQFFGVRSLRLMALELNLETVFFFFFTPRRAEGESERILSKLHAQLVKGPTLGFSSHHDLRVMRSSSGFGILVYLL